MVCIYCHNDTSVENSRLQKRSNQVWRRRACKACRAVFTTHESIDYSSALLVLNNGSNQPFISDRLFASILTCMPHREDRFITAREATYTVISKLICQQTAASVSTDVIIETTTTVLKALDKKAYLHYTANHIY